MSRKTQNKLSETAEGRMILWAFLAQRKPEMKTLMVAGIVRELKTFCN